MRQLTRLLFGAIALLVCAGEARASDTYPVAVQEALDMPCAPPCTICHATFAGGAGTVTQPFGGAMVSRGLRDSDDDCIPKALEAVRLGQTGNACRGTNLMDGTPADSDMDLTPDIVELEAGDDPNRPSAGASVCVITYGCGARIAPESRSAPIAAGASLLMLALFALRRRGPQATRRD